VKTVILKNNLKNGLDGVGRAIGSNLNLPVLGGVLVKASGSQIQISATNLELAITKSVFGKVVEEGGVVVPYGIFASTINNISSERINLEKTKQGNLEIKTDNYSATIQTINEKEFPIIPKIENKKDFLEIEAQALRDALSKVVVAGEESELRPEIGGVLFTGEAAELRLAATDSFRLAEAKIFGAQLKNKNKKTTNVTVPLKTTQELIKATTEEEDSVKIYFENNQALFETASTSIISRLIEGDFPDYKSIVPSDTDTNIIIKKEELISALKLASSFANKTNDVKINTKDKKIVEVYSGDSSVGENKYLIPAKIEGPDTEAVFNWRYLLDGVKTGSGKEVFVGLNGGEKPAVIKTPGDEACFYILMPVNRPT
jgi:DNA polymerase III subunit beta